MTAVGATLQVLGARFKNRASVTAFLSALAAVVAVTLLERRASSLTAADRALGGISLGLVLPLFAYGTVARALGRGNLENAFTELARFGVSRRTAGLSAGLGSLLVLAPAGALIALLAVVVARAPADPLLWRDAVTSSWIGALAGVCYAAYFVLGSSFGSRGGGRSVLCVVDFVAGTSGGIAAVWWPRGHVANLLGARPVLDMPQWSASLALVLLTCVYLGVAVWRVRR